MTKMESRSFHANTLHGKVVGGIVVAVGAIFLFVPEAVVSDGMLIGFVLIALGAGVLLINARTASDKGPRMTVSDAGVWHRDWGVDVVPWDAIGRVYFRGSRFKITICVELNDPERFVAAMSPADRSRLRSNPLIQLPVLRIPPTALDAPVDELLMTLRNGLQGRRGEA